MAWRSRLWAAIAASLMGMAVVGCGQSAPPPAPPIPTADVKKLLEEIAASGQPNSGLNNVGPFLEKLKAQDSTLAASLQEDLAKLQSTQQPDEVKEIAGRMASKL